MWLGVEHTTVFRYDSPIAEAYTELRMKPATMGGQRCASFRVEVEPHGSHLHSYVDRFGNEVVHFDLLAPHDELVVSCTSDVFTPASFAVDERELSLLDRYDYLQETGYAGFAPSVRELGAAAAADDPDETALALLEAVHGTMAYEPGVSTVTTTAAQALELGRGVCQDFTHVFLAACRARGVPARYVSGYLHDPGGTGEQATHAWVDVWSEQRGWVALDPTHNREQTEHYARVAVGRDYADVAPTRGVHKGSPSEHLEVRVSVRAI